MNGFISILLAAKSAFVLCALFYLPGLAWVWLLPARTRIELCGTALVIGLSIILIPAIVLAEIGHFTSTALWLWAAFVIAGGLIAGQMATRKTTRSCVACFQNGFTGFYALILALCVLYSLPNRGEWIAGGWDPGVNINQGLLVANTGSVAQAPDPIRANGLQTAPDSFARQLGSFTEIFPGVPTDPTSGAITPYFYRATPTLVAISNLVGSRSAALRVNHLTGLFALTIFLALLSTARLPRLAILAGGLALALQPIFIAHTAIPASEMFGLAIVCATGLLLLREERGAQPLLALTLALGALNRASFLFYQTFLLLILVVWDASDSNRRRVTSRHLALAGALFVGLAWYKWVSPTSVYKIRHLYPLLTKLALGSLCLTLTIDGSLVALRRALPRWTRFLTLLAPLALLAREFTLQEPWAEFFGNCNAWFAYATPAIAVLGALGILWQFRKSALTPWLLWLFTALLAVLLHRHAENLYPWASKRWLAYSPALLATGIASFLHSANTLPRLLKMSCIAAVSLGLCATLPLAREAWRNTEYNGLNQALHTVASFIEREDLVVTDHFLWGTPLALAYGHEVLDAESLLAGRGDAEEAMRALKNSGRRIVLVNSIDDHLVRWPDVFKSAVPLMAPVELHTRTIIQHRSHRMFDMRDVSFTFQAYLWQPSQ